jgi:REP element-mobilizing transposase RayT
MPQSLASIHLHVVFSTKHRESWLTAPFAQRTYDYIGGTLRGNGCALIAAGGIPDHVHLLVSMSRELNVAELVKLVKSNSSRWIHDTFPELHAFAWQAGYGAFAVSYANIPNVRAYLANQEKHHAKESFQDEFRDFLRRHEMTWDEKYVWD